LLYGRSEQKYQQSHTKPIFVDTSDKRTAVADYQKSVWLFHNQNGGFLAATCT